MLPCETELHHIHFKHSPLWIGVSLWILKWIEVQHKLQSQTVSNKGWVHHMVYIFMHVNMYVYIMMYIFKSLRPECWMCFVLLRTYMSDSFNPWNKNTSKMIKTQQRTLRTSIEIVLYFQKYMYSLLQRLQSKKNCLCNKKLSN